MGMVMSAIFGLAVAIVVGGAALYLFRKDSAESQAGRPDGSQGK